MRYFFTKPLAPGAGMAVITGSDARHIKTVLRLKPGDRIGLFDGSGIEYEAKIAAVTTGRIEASVIRRFSSKVESPVQIIIAQGLLKDRKMDGLVRHMTELGITKWIPFLAHRSIPKPDKKNLIKRKKRWETIAKEAAKQCKRARIPEISELVSFEKALDMGVSCNLKIAFWENEVKPIDAIATVSEGQLNTIFAMLGPEGGFTSHEIETAKSRGFISAALGPRILKAETATIAVGVLLQYLFGDMGQKTLDIK
ncbi:MAG: 16S rRNA (uracil(1498)-N(3))-methyltransferase [Desulfobacterales bacterium]|nr:MAG: 16S rRNA (uracil(1498)-N(3))-methyltransferase [Desulfobacterales bacterium]